MSSTSTTTKNIVNLAYDGYNKNILLLDSNDSAWFADVSSDPLNINFTSMKYNVKCFCNCNI